MRALKPLLGHGKMFLKNGKSFNKNQRIRKTLREN